MANPDLAGLLRRPRVEKPRDEFLLPPPPAETITRAEGQTAGAVPVPSPSLVENLVEEAARVQELIDTLLATADRVTVGVPPEDAQRLGPTLTTAQYVQAVENPSQPGASRIQQHFEWGLLKETGPVGLSWSLLALPDLTHLRNQLVSAGQTLAGSLLPPDLSTASPTWTEDALGSHLADIHQALLASSTNYRTTLLSALGTAHHGLEGQALNALLDPLSQVPDALLRRTLQQLAQALQTLRSLLSHAQLLAAFEYLQTRDLLVSTLKQLVVEQLLQTVITVLSQARGALVEPLLNLLAGGLDGNHSLPLDDATSRELAGVVTGTLTALLAHYNNTAADLLREVNREQRLRQQKLQALGERSVFGGWIRHLDQILLLLRQLLAAASPTQQGVALLLQHARQAPPPPASALDRQLQAGGASEAFAVRNPIPASPSPGGLA